MTLIAVALVLLWVGMRVRGLLRPAPARTFTAHRPQVELVLVGDDRAGAMLEVLDRLADRADDVAVAVVGDGEEVGRRTLDAIAARLADPQVGAVQPAIRAAHVDTLLARMQDLEWVGVGELHASRGQAVGALGTGPAAPVYRLGALRQLAGWPDGPADDVLVAAALAEQGWRLEAARTAVVDREPVATMGALLRGRVEIAGGLLRGIPAGVRLLPRDRAVATALLAPLGLLAVGALLVAAVAAAALDPAAAAEVVGGWRLLAWYAVLFAPAWVGGFAYWSRTDDVGIVQSVQLGHLFVLWSTHWLVVTWIALLTLRFRRSRLRRGTTTDARH